VIKVRIPTAERTVEGRSGTNLFYFQHQRIYTFCQEFVKNKSVLEFGSGYGSGAYRLSEFAREVLAIDLDRRSINESARRFKRDNLRFIPGDAESFVSSKKYEVIVAFQLIEHLKNPDKFIKNICLNLTNEGLLILSTPNAFTQSYNENPYHYREYSAGELRKLLSKYFKNVRLLGLFGDKKVIEYEIKRRLAVAGIFGWDRWGFRKLLPRRLKQKMFDIFAYIRMMLCKWNSTKWQNFSESNSLIKNKELNRAIDFIVICKNKLPARGELSR